MEKVNRVNRYLGLMFLPRRKAKPLLFEFDKLVNYSIHSWFVFFKFLAIWYDKDGKVIKRRVVRPFTYGIKPKKPYYKLIEIPL